MRKESKSAAGRDREREGEKEGKEHTDIDREKNES